MKTFNFRIEEDPDLNKSIKINTNQCKDINDLIQIVSKDLGIDKEHFTFEKEPKNEIKNIQDGRSFKIKIINPSPDVTFELPNGETALIKDCNKMNIGKIIDCLQKNEPTLKYSPICILKNFDFYLFGIKVKKNTTNHFEYVPPNVKVKIQLTGNFITLNCYQYQLTFFEKEKISSVFKFINDAFNISGSFIKIYRESSNSFLSTNDILQKDDTFLSIEMNVACNFMVISSSNFNGQMNHFEITKTILDIKNFFASIYSDDHNLTSDDIIIKSNGKEITDTSKTILEYYTSGDISFFLDIKNRKQAQNAGKSDNPNKKKEEANLKNTPKSQHDETKEQNTGNKQSQVNTPSNNANKSHYKANQQNASTNQIQSQKQKTEINFSKSQIKSKTHQTASNPQQESNIAKSHAPKVQSHTKSDTSPDQKSQRDKKMIFFKLVKSDNRFHDSFPSSTKLADIENKVKAKFSLKGEISFKFKENDSHFIDKESQLCDISDEIRDNNLNIIYVEEEKTTPKPSSIQKQIENENDKKITSKTNQLKNQIEKKNDHKSIQTDNKNSIQKKNAIPPPPPTKPGGKRMNKYKYQTNQDDKTVYEVELDSNATVRKLKRHIQKVHNVKSLYDIKVLFAGKDLFNSLNLEELDVCSTILFVYIRSQADILLMTAKALKVLRSEDLDDYDYD